MKNNIGVGLFIISLLVIPFIMSTLIFYGMGNDSYDYNDTLKEVTLDQYTELVEYSDDPFSIISGDQNKYLATYKFSSGRSSIAGIDGVRNGLFVFRWIVLFIIPAGWYIILGIHFFKGEKCD